MARYIDTDILRKNEIARCHCVPCVGSNDNNYKDLDEVLNDCPTADVAPKSEVAREIFGEIENVIDNELQNNYKVLPQFEFSNELWNKMSGRIEALKEICDFIVELKKKYTEEKG